MLSVVTLRVPITALAALDTTEMEDHAPVNNIIIIIIIAAERAKGASNNIIRI